LETLKRNLPIALATLPFHLYVWFAYAHLSFNTVPLGSMELNSLCVTVMSVVLGVFLILTASVLLPSNRRVAIGLAIVIVVSHYIVSGNIYRIRNTASYYIEKSSAGESKK
jgi:hypothetical protein